MKKAKVIIGKVNACLVKSCKKVGNVHVLSRVIFGVAILMVLVALGVVCFYKPAREAVFSHESHTVVDVKSGDTLSKILSAQGFSIQDINTISKNLKKETLNR